MNTGKTEHQVPKTPDGRGLGKTSTLHEAFLDTLPKDWTFDRLKDVVSLRNEKSSESSEAEDYLELEDLESGTGRILNRRNTLEVESAVTLFKKGDVLFGKLRPYLEKYYLAKFDGKCTGEILAFNPERVSGYFLRYCVSARWFIERCNTLAYGAKMPRVNWTTQLAYFNIPLPPPAEQERIAAFLDASCAAIDAAVAIKQKQIAVLYAQRESLIEHAVTKGLRNDAPMRPVNMDWIDNMPSHWDICRIKRIVSRVDYGISRSTEQEGRYPVLKMGNIQGGEIEFRDLDFVDEVADDLLLQKDDILYNRTNSPDQVGKAAIFRGNKDDKITFASYLVRLRTNHRADPHYLNYLVNCSGFLFFARKLAIQSVQQSNLNSTRYCRLLIPRPPLDEQRTIAAYLDDKTAQIAGVVWRIESQISTLMAFRKSQIHECVTGQKRITESDLKKVKAYG